MFVFRILQCLFNVKLYAIGSRLTWSLHFDWEDTWISEKNQYSSVPFSFVNLSKKLHIFPQVSIQINLKISNILYNFRILEEFCCSATFCRFIKLVIFAFHFILYFGNSIESCIVGRVILWMSLRCVCCEFVSVIFFFPWIEF